MRLQAHILRVEFLYDLEKANRAIGQIVRALERKMFKGMHGKRTIAFVIVSSEFSVDLMRRLRPTLESVDGIDNYWIHLAPPTVLARHGSLDPLATAVKQAWDHINGQGGKPKHMREA